MGSFMYLKFPENLEFFRTASIMTGKVTQKWMIKQITKVKHKSGSQMWITKLDHKTGSRNWSKKMDHKG